MTDSASDKSCPSASNSTTFLSFGGSFNKFGNDDWCWFWRILIVILVLVLLVWAALARYEGCAMY